MAIELGSRMRKTLTCLLLFGLSLLLAPTLSSQESSTSKGDAARKAILVTGASSGIGRMTAELLADSGYFVYAGARKQKDLDSLNALENVQAIRLDVTVQEEIDAAVLTIEQAGRGLFGLINNAGVVSIAPLIEVTEDDLQFVMDVNVFGPYRITKAFAPLLIKSKGRVATTGSISGAGTWALGGSYCMSKFAIEAYTDVLAAEMAQFGVQVCVVEPGNFKSDITKSMKQRMQSKGYSTEGSLYQNALDNVFGGSQDRSQYKEPTAVAEAFLSFLKAEHPQRRYMVVPNLGEGYFAVNSAMQRLVQMNGDQEHSFDREQLIAMLDAALAAQKKQ